MNKLIISKTYVLWSFCVRFALVQREASSDFELDFSVCQRTR